MVMVRTREPAVGTAPVNEECPNAVHEMAFSVVQFTVTSWPTSTVIGETVMLIRGLTGSGGVMISRVTGSELALAPSLAQVA